MFWQEPRYPRAVRVKSDLLELSGDGAVVPSPHVLALGDWHFQVELCL